ncbi:hypothetical protein COLINT_03343 [Collinsella intestinalis DSM 13280]|uniref:Uncharacterized protein n=1 Tax=Collinsella intestinalis DSM 13280 TaxID=521003 RepID=C4FB90_9ACTN|nr:hypothetical protein COLINT_03343 [Collinsella intestinalis DSM 13280]
MPRLQPLAHAHKANMRMRCQVYPAALRVSLVRASFGQAVKRFSVGEGAVKRRAPTSI